MFEDPTLQSKWEACPSSLQAVVEEFEDAFPEERLELMIDFADALPDLPARLQGKRDEMEQVHECQSPVFLFTELEKGGVHFYFDIPREAPTIRGYASLLSEGLNGVSPQTVLEIPDDFYRLLGLDKLLSHLRVRGLHALVIYMKRQVQDLM